MTVQVKRHQKRLRTADLGYSEWSEHSRPIHFWKALSASLNLRGKRGCGQQYNWRTALELPVAPDVRMGAATLQNHGFPKCGRNLLAELPSDPAFEPYERDLEPYIC